MGSPMRQLGLWRQDEKGKPVKKKAFIFNELF